MQAPPAVDRARRSRRARRHGRGARPGGTSVCSNGRARHCPPTASPWRGGHRCASCGSWPNLMHEDQVPRIKPAPHAIHAFGGCCSTANRLLFENRPLVRVEQPCRLPASPGRGSWSARTRSIDPRKSNPALTQCADLDLKVRRSAGSTTRGTSPARTSRRAANHQRSVRLLPA